MTVEMFVDGIAPRSETRDFENMRTPVGNFRVRNLTGCPPDAIPVIARGHAIYLGEQHT